MTLRKILPTIFLAMLAATGAAEAKKSLPAAPSKLKVTALGVNAFKLKWKDNSNNEDGWEVLVALKGSKPQHFLYIPRKDITSYTVFTNDLPGYGVVFQLAAYKGEPGKEKSGEISAMVPATGLSPKTFKKPSDLVAKPLDDARIRLTWVDNSTSEAGYQILFREKGVKKWSVLGTVETALKYNIVASGLPPSKEFQFRVRAFSLGGASATPFSNTAAGKTMGLLAPAKLVATPLPEGSFEFKWRDRSSAESGFELQQAIGTGEFAPYWSFSGYNVSKKTLKATLKSLSMNKDLRFRMRAFRVVGTTKTYSAFSNISAQRSTGLNTPSDIAVTARTESTIALKWKDLSSRETGYRIEYRKVNASAFVPVATASNVTIFTLTGLEPDSQYEFRVMATDFFSGSISPEPALVRARTSPGVTGNVNLLVSVGVPFSHTVQLTSVTGLSQISMTGLPAGLTFNPANRKITGTVATTGMVKATVTAKFSDGSTSVRTFYLRSIAPPLAASAFSPVTVASGDSSTVGIAGKFSDSDALSAARFETTSGSFDIIFFPTQAPLTVDNFINYLDDGKYDTMFFHRSVKDFVVQGGGYQYSVATGFKEVVKDPEVTNEPGISNLRGTVAMAKKQFFPNSATSEWFVNLKDNSAGTSALDTTNGGFTVFGRVPESGMAVFEEINAMPRATYSFPFTPQARSLSEVPIDAVSAPTALDPTKLVKVISAGPAPLLTYTVTSLHPAIATATVVANDLVITGVAPGVATLRVTATDLDGQAVNQEMTVTVN
ncbi:MAG: peptidylprolyl isomerase [Verrucomicrobiota bacterium]